MKDSKSLLITRIKDNGVQTIGTGLVLGNTNEILYEFKTLELPWKDNQKRISCIPIGIYNVIRYKSPKFGEVFLLENVSNRSMIEIHYGNYFSDIEGCILVGENFKDINKDGHVDVTSSKNTLNDLLDIMPETFKLEIINKF